MQKPWLGLACFSVFFLRMGKVWTWCCRGVSALALGVSYAVLVFFFAIVGCTLGALTGALIGLKSKRGLFHVTAWGAVAGGVFVVIAFDALVAFWLSDDGHFSLFVPWNETQAKHKVVELVQQVLSSLTQWPSEQMRGDALGSGSADMLLDRAKMSNHSFDRMSSIVLTEEHLMDYAGNRMSCPICLEDFKCEDAARRLPHCHHLFHRQCIDKWFSGHISCPLCRNLVIQVK